MTDVELNKAVASVIPETQRWWRHWEHGQAFLTNQCQHCHGTGAQGSESDCWMCPSCRGSGEGPERYIGPDFCADLNAMHEAINGLNPEQQDEFAIRLAAVVLEIGIDAWWDLNANETAHVANASARQRAKAFLCVLQSATTEKGKR